jgi:hypothetical protein
MVPAGVAPGQLAARWRVPSPADAHVNDPESLTRLRALRQEHFSWLGGGHALSSGWTRGAQPTPTVCRSGSITTTTRSCPRG